MNRKTLLAGFAVVVIAAIGIVIALKWPSGDTELRKVTFQLDWKAEPTFVGIYRAKERLAKQGIQLEIVEGNGAALSAQTIGAGKSGWIGISSAPATAMARSKGVPVKSVTVLYPNTNSVIYSLESNPVRKPGDLVGKTIGLVPGSVTVAEYKTMLKINGVDRSKVNEISAGFDPSPLLSGQAAALMTYGEALPVALKTQGHPIVTMPVKSYGVRMYAMNVIVNDDAASRETESIKKIRDGILAEYAWVRSDPAAAAEYFLKLFPDRDPKYVRESLKVVAEYLGGDVGRQTTDGWKATIQLLKDANLLGEKTVSPDDVTMSSYLAE